MRGMYRYLADAGLFTECLTRKTFPVAQEKDNAALESAYARARRTPGEELLVNVEGQVAMRPKMEGEGRQATLVVERFAGVWPGETCGSRFSTEPLESTYWKLHARGQRAGRRELSGNANPITSSVRSLVVSPARAAATASPAAIELSGDQLTFGQMAGTMMACPDGMDTEKAFLGALSQAKRAKITRQHLELFDATGNLVARFEARHMP